MKYIRATITSSTRGVFYKKDFQVQKVFTKIARIVASALIETQLLSGNEDYKAFITPCYGPYKRVTVNSTVPERPVNSDGPWIALDYAEGLQAERPIDYIAVELSVRRGNKEYRFRTTFEMVNLDYFWANIDNALAQVGLADHELQWERKLYARDDTEANFDYEEVSTNEQNTDPLIEIMTSDEITPAFPGKTFADFPILSTRRLVRGQLIEEPYTEASKDSVSGGVHVLITKSALQELQEAARSGLHVEQGGVLVGLIYQNEDSQHYFIEITNHIAAEGARASELELHYTFESWQHQTVLLKQRFPGLRTVGWYHTHLDLVKRAFSTNEPAHTTYTTPLFFSKDDHFTHRQFFREKWYVAMVLDPAGNLTFFQWNGDKIGETPRFYVLEAQSKG